MRKKHQTEVESEALLGDDNSCACVDKPFLHCHTRLYYSWLPAVLIITALIISSSVAVYRIPLDNLELKPRDCDIPRLNPWDRSLQPYLNKGPIRISCKRVQPELTVLDPGNQHLFFNDTELGLTSLTMDQLRCEYRYIRIGIDDYDVSYSEWKALLNGTFIEEEFVDVRCYNVANNSAIIYENAHSQIVPIAAETDNDEIAQALQGSPSTNEFSFLNRPNVIMFVVDSMSNLNWRRELPRTLSRLSNSHHQGGYDSFIFDGLMKVGINSLPNAAAFFAGRRPLPGHPRHYFEDYPLVFKEYQKHGYAVLFSLDMPQHPLFTYNRSMSGNGSEERVELEERISHYYRAYQVHAMNSRLQNESRWPCFGNNIRQLDHLQYLQQFVRKYLNDTGKANSNQGKPHRRHPIFAVNWLSEYSHGDNWINALDDDFERFFAENAALLNDETFVFAMGDHGPRYHPIRQTAIGRIEERMPFFSMHVPRKLMDRYPQLARRLRDNTQRLSTWWDLHVTLKEILDLGVNDRWDELINGEQMPERYERDYGAHAGGLSMLRPLPRQRNCSSAHVSLDFCSCQREIHVDVKNPLVRAMAESFMARLKKWLDEAPEGHLCASLKFHEINRAAVFVLDHGGLKPFDLVDAKFDDRLHYRITIVVEPSGAMLEANFRRRKANETSEVGDDFMMGEFDRLNAYGWQSNCVKTQWLKSVCFCLKHMAFAKFPPKAVK